MIITTIKKRWFKKKMEDLEMRGFFYEYKEDKPYWGDRLLPLQSQVPIKIVFLVGNKPHKFMCVEIGYISKDYVEGDYQEAINTRMTWRLKCVRVKKQR